ncbi:MAG: hypothetical protein R3C11_01570 [Planctomycetaceae bacterium]
MWIVNKHWADRFWKLWANYRLGGGQRDMIGRCPSPTMRLSEMKKLAEPGYINRTCGYRACPFCYMRRVPMNVYTRVKELIKATPNRKDYRLVYLNFPHHFEIASHYPEEGFNHFKERLDLEYKLTRDIPGGRDQIHPYRADE